MNKMRNYLEERGEDFYSLFGESLVA